MQIHMDFCDNTIQKNEKDKFFHMLREYFPWFLCIYDSYNIPVKKADVVRPFYMIYYGGMYLDLDVECLVKFFSFVKNISNNDFEKPYDELIVGKHVIIPVMGNDTTWLLDRHGLTNMYFASVSQFRPHIF